MTAKILKILITLSDALTSIMHVIFQIYLLERENIGIYAKFLLTENILIAMFFLCLCVILILSKYNKTIILYNIVVWFFFILCILLLKPENTTLDILNLTFSFKQWIILLGIAYISLITNLAYLFLISSKGKSFYANNVHIK